MCVCVLLCLQLVRFSDKTTQGLASDNTELREQLEKMRGQLVEARSRAREGGDASGNIKESSDMTQMENGREEKRNCDDSVNSGKLDMYKAQINDLKKQLVHLQEV